MRRWVTSSETYRKNFEILKDGTNRCNSAYHFQFIEHCLRHRIDLESTTRSFVNRTVLVELGSIVEMILHELLSDMQVKISPKKEKNLQVRENSTLGQLLEIASHYELVDSSTKQSLEKLKKWRNSIHFKSHKKERILEYNYYTDDMVKEGCEIFSEFLKNTHKNITGKSKTDFSFPWSNV